MADSMSSLKHEIALWLKTNTSKMVYLKHV